MLYAGNSWPRNGGRRGNGCCSCILPERPWKTARSSRDCNPAKQSNGESSRHPEGISCYGTKRRRAVVSPREQSWRVVHQLCERAFVGVVVHLQRAD